jgi:DNA replication protein DnaC
MERTQLFDLMGELKLFGMKAAFDEIMATAVKRQHEPQRIVGDLLNAEISEKQARSIKYQLTIAKLPLAKDLDDFQFAGTPINETLVNDLAGGGFIAQQRNAVLVGGTESGSYCPPRYAVRMPSHFDVDRQTTAPEYGVDPQRA